MIAHQLQRTTLLTALFLGAFLFIVYINIVPFCHYILRTSPNPRQELTRYTRPEPSTFSEIRNNYGWRPQDRKAHREFVQQMIALDDSNPEQELLPVIEELRVLIETNPRIYMFFTQMFREEAWAQPYWRQLVDEVRLRDYNQLLRIMNRIMRTAPPYGILFPPMSTYLGHPMSTPSGHHAFLDPEVNAMLKKVLNEWGRYLQTSSSASVLGTDSKGWLGSEGLNTLEEAANEAYNTSKKFDEIYQCDPSQEHFGFKSWDEFFTRKFREGIRPVANPDNDDVIVSACESIPFNVQRDIKLRDDFFVKGEPYSVVDMLGNDESATKFVGGTVFQAFLSIFSYHRWHSPISGTIRRSFLIDGTYYSDNVYKDVGFSSANDVGTLGIGTSLAYLSSMATRAVVIIEADNPKIGLVAFVAIGMEEVSTCDITVKEGQHVEKGEELGMFHFGGSSYCLIFQGGVELGDFPVLGNFSSPNMAVNSKLAVVQTPGESREWL